MLTTALFAVGASAPLAVGALVGVRWNPPKRLMAAALAYAAGALIVSASFELFEPAYRDGGPWRAGLAFAAGALVFVTADSFLDRRTAGSAAGLALLAGVTLDGIPENTAFGVSLNDSGSVALLVAVFASNFPEALAGARRMLGKGRAPAFVVSLWCAAAVLLAVAVCRRPLPVRRPGSPGPVLPAGLRGRCCAGLGDRHPRPRGVRGGRPRGGAGKRRRIRHGFLLSL